ncbi:MAG: hypothetical protein J6J18_13235, partial [Oscillospiraceae bacterium]|nr:hypothetical protein [Oscillospiraceae bacterium]
HSQHRADGKTYDADSNFRCPTYKSMYGECTMHFIKASTLDSLVDEAIGSIYLPHIYIVLFIQLILVMGVLWAVRRKSC